MDSDTLLGIMILFGMLSCIFIPLLLIRKFFNKKFSYIPRTILCLPSGELIKIKDSNWEKLIRKRKIKWSNKYKHYITNDVYSKYKIKKLNIIK